MQIRGVWRPGPVRAQGPTGLRGRRWGSRRLSRWLPMVSKGLRAPDMGGAALAGWVKAGLNAPGGSPGGFKRPRMIPEAFDGAILAA